MRACHARACSYADGRKFFWGGGAPRCRCMLRTEDKDFRALGASRTLIELEG